jgi:uncharacterized ion transporter superfamily protein YfcC
MKNSSCFKILLALIVLGVIATWLTGCSTVNKLFHKNKTSIDSLYSHKEKIDSSASFDSLSLHKENTTVLTKKDSSKYNEQTTIKEKTTIKEFDTSGKIRKQTVISKTTEIKKINEAGSIIVFENAGRIDSNDLKKDAQVSRVVNDSGHLKQQTKIVDKEVHKKTAFQFLWWLLLLIPAYLTIRNWKTIRKILIGF